MINVVIGPASSGKTETLIARVTEAVANGRRGIYLIVPSAPAATVLRDRLNETTGGLSLQDGYASVTTFPVLYRSILDKTGVDYHWLAAVERDAVLRYVINELAQAGKLQYFGETAEMPGLVNSLGEWIEELWRGYITPQAFARIAEARGDKDRDIARVFDGYAAALETLNAVDPESAGHAALSAVEKAREPRGWFSMIAVDGFDFLTATQVQLLSTCAARGVEVIVSLTYDEARAIHYWQRPTVARLQAAGASFTPFATTPKDLIQVAAAALMDERRVTEIIHSDAGGGISIISAPDRAAEVRAAAREIKRLAIEDHLPLDEVSLVCRSLSVYAPHIERIFDECAVPVMLDNPLRVAENTAVTALLRLFALSGKSFKRRACVEAWRSPYFDWSAFGFDEQAVDLLDAISLARNVTHGREQWRAAIKPPSETESRDRGLAEHESPESQKEADRPALYQRLANGLEGWFDTVTPQVRATRQAHFAWAARLIEQSRVDAQAASGDMAARDSLALDEFKKILAAVAHDPLIRREDDMAWPAFLADVERALASMSYDRSTPAHPCVVAQEAHRLRPRRYRIIFVLGLIEGEFPARLTERAPYTLAERAELRQAGLDLTETITDAGADLLQFYKAMSCATERLYLSFARTDVAGGELLPSYLIEEVQPFAAASVRRIAPAFSHEEYEMTWTCSLDELAMRTARALRLSSEGKQAGTRAATDLLDSLLPSWRMTERGARMELQRMHVTPNPNSGWINDPSLVAALKERFGPAHLWSATQINDYGTCPFRFFAQHALKLDAGREPGEGFASHHLGQAYHRILEQLYRRLHTDNLLIQSHTAEQAIDEAARIADNVLQQMLDSGEVRRDSLWEFNKEEIKRRVGRLLRREAAWNDEEPARPVDCERRFGYDDTEALVIECPGGAAKFRGIVDRIDYREKSDDWVVVDYKTRRTPIPVRDAREGRNLQLPLYAMAASRVIKKGERVSAAYYLHVHSRKRGSELKSGSETKYSLEELIDHAEQLIRLYVEQVRGGRFPVQPNGDTVCQTCEYDVMCRIQSLRTFEDEQDRDG
ncbi:MAG TPA: PD-(D/E)XK nuclease family protein [Blastocatellia bacterium]|nr:PD-(D/E)XK nuclease family protein [Blastocatellia bacterium]